MKVAWLIVLLVASSLFLASNALPTGPPLAACQDMVPQHAGIAPESANYSLNMGNNSFVAGGAPIDGKYLLIKIECIT